MNKTTKKAPAKKPPVPLRPNPLLQEMWDIKDKLSAARGHDVHRLFAEAREREKVSGHRVVNLQEPRKKPPHGGNYSSNI